MLQGEELQTACVIYKNNTFNAVFTHIPWVIRYKRYHSFIFVVVLIVYWFTFSLLLARILLSFPDTYYLYLSIQVVYNRCIFIRLFIVSQNHISKSNKCRLMYSLINNLQGWEQMKNILWKKLFSFCMDQINYSLMATFNFIQ